MNGVSCFFKLTSTINRFCSTLSDTTIPTCNVMNASWFLRPNPEDRINRKPEDQKYDQTTEKPKNRKIELYCF